MSLAVIQKPFVVPIFIPHAGCPHRCVFCNQTSTSSHPERLPARDQLDAEIQQFLSYRKDAGRRTEISFFGGNFLGLHKNTIGRLLKHATRYVSSGKAHGIRFSTRPDTIDQDRIDLLAKFPISTIELGVQSMNNRVLTISRRGHTAEDVHQAVSMLREKPYRLGLQMMVGLPEDTRETTFATGEAIIKLAPDFVRIYPTIVLEGSPLARWHRKGRYDPLDLDAAISQVKHLYAAFIRNGIPVIRMGLQATDGLDMGSGKIAGPYHPAFGELVHSALWLDAMQKVIDAQPTTLSALDIRLNPKLVSRVKGQHHHNLNALKFRYRLSHIHLVTDTNLGMERILVNGRSCRITK